jgi:hypothetical protein
LIDNLIGDLIRFVGRLEQGNPFWGGQVSFGFILNLDKYPCQVKYYNNYIFYAIFI